MSKLRKVLDYIFYKSWFNFILGNISVILIWVIFFGIVRFKPPELGVVIMSFCTGFLVLELFYCFVYPGQARKSWKDFLAKRKLEKEKFKGFKLAEKWYVKYDKDGTEEERYNTMKEIIVDERGDN